MHRSYKSNFIYTVLSRAVGVLLLGLSWVAVNLYMTKDDTALYFLYVNILTFYGLVEQGIGTVGVIWIANEAKDCNLIDNDINIDNIGILSIFYKIKSHFCKSANYLLAFLLFLGTAYYLFTAKISVFNLVVFFVFAILFCFYIKNMPFQILLEGLGYVNNIQLYRIVELIISYLVLIISIYATRSILSLPLWMFIRVICQRSFFKLMRVKIPKLDGKDMNNDKIFAILKRFNDQKHKMSISNLAGFVIFNTSIPYVFNYSAPQVSAAFSQTFTLCNQIQLTLSGFINNNIHNYFKAQLSCGRKFIHDFVLHNIFICIIYALIFFILTLVSYQYHFFGKYILYPAQFAILGLAFFIYMIATSFIVYDRMRRVENFKGVGMASAFITILFYCINSFGNYFDPAYVAIFTFTLTAIAHLLYSIFVIFKVDYENN